MTRVRPDVCLDTRSLINPMPVLKTRKAIDSMQSGQLLEIHAKDAAAKSDIIYLTQRLNMELIALSEEDGSIRITIRK